MSIRTDFSAEVDTNRENVFGATRPFIYMPRSQPPKDLHPAAQRITNTVTPLKPSSDSFHPQSRHCHLSVSQSMSSDAIAAYYSRRLSLTYQAARIIIHLRISAPGEESFRSRRQCLGAFLLLKPLPFHAPFPGFAFPPDNHSHTHTLPPFPLIRYGLCTRLSPYPKPHHQLHPPQDIKGFGISKFLLFLTPPIRSHKPTYLFRANPSLEYTSSHSFYPRIHRPNQSPPQTPPPTNLPAQSVSQSDTPTRSVCLSALYSALLFVSFRFPQPRSLQLCIRFRIPFHSIPQQSPLTHSLTHSLTHHLPARPFSHEMRFLLLLGYLLYCDYCFSDAVSGALFCFVVGNCTYVCGVLGGER